jgi:hypothetical protein
VADPDPPAERVSALRFPDGWFTPLLDVEHQGPPSRERVRSALVVTGDG